MRKLLKISPSTLSQFCAYQTEKFEGTDWQVTKEGLIAFLKGQKLWSPALTKGHIFHKLLELGTEGYVQTDGSLRVASKSKNETIYFDDYTRRLIDRFRELHPEMIHEVPCQLKMSVLGYEIISNMRMDAINPFPLRIHDFKTSSKQYGRVFEDEYYDSMQWRMYLLACDDVDNFQYDIFHFQDNVPGATRSIEYYKFQFWRESDMESLVGEYMMGLIQFCERNGLIDFLTVKS